MEIEITEEEIEKELEAWIRDGLQLSRERIIKILKEQKERELWTEDGSTNKEGD